ncbi:MAG: 50S ribosomal protein L6 [Alphaproteobacteria bacterium]|nr:50S ribosomal protein L6 [Alphaproteobacteria bacterium]
MSRIGKNPVPIPDGVDVQVVGQTMTAKGKLGVLELPLSDNVEVKIEDNEIRVRPVGESKRARQMWGTMRSLVDNIVTGVSEGFTVNLEIHGVGYRASVEGDALNLQLGYSHDVRYTIPDGITIKCERPTLISVSGANKQRVGQVAAEIRAYRKPEPYKGKGVRYANEYILRKEGKKK